MNFDSFLVIRSLFDVREETTSRVSSSLFSPSHRRQQDLLWVKLLNATQGESTACDGQHAGMDWSTPTPLQFRL